MKLLLLLSSLISAPMLAAELTEHSMQDYIKRLEIRLAQNGSLSEIYFSVENLKQFEDYVNQLSNNEQAERLQKIVEALRENKAFQEDAPLAQHASRLKKLVLLLHAKKHIEQQSKEACKSKQTSKRAKRSSRRISVPVFEVFAPAGDLGASKAYSTTLVENKAKATEVHSQLAIVYAIIESLEHELNRVQTEQAIIDKMLLDYPTLRSTVQDKYEFLTIEKVGYLEELSLQKIKYADLEMQASQIYITSEQTKSALLGRIDSTTTELQQIESALAEVEIDSMQLKAEISEFQHQINKRLEALTSSDEQRITLEARHLFLKSKQREHRGYKKQLAEDNLSTAVAQGKLLPKPDSSQSSDPSSSGQ